MSDTRTAKEFVNVQVGHGLKRALEKLALDNERSVSAEVRIAIRRHLKQAERETA
jgi:hypothetical protein